jgi:hypothetical protein
MMAFGPSRSSGAELTIPILVVEYFLLIRPDSPSPGGPLPGCCRWRVLRE